MYFFTFKSFWGFPRDQNKGGPFEVRSYHYANDIGQSQASSKIMIFSYDFRLTQKSNSYQHLDLDFCKVKLFTGLEGLDIQFCSFINFRKETFKQRNTIDVEF